MRKTLGNITPDRIAQLQTVPGQPLAMTGRVKAAVIVRLLLAEGSPLPLSSLPEHMQAALTEQIGRMRLVDRTTLGAVVEEFLNELEQVGLSFPGGIEGALSMMDGHISTTAANRLRRLASASGKADPWDRIIVLDEDRLLPVLEEESEEVAAVMLSKLPIPRAASLLGRLPGDKARRVAYAVSQTGNVDPEMGARLIRLFSELNRLGTTVLIATHDRMLVEATRGLEIRLVEGRAMKKEYTVDGFLPNAAGYARMAPLAEKAIAEALAR